MIDMSELLYDDDLSTHYAVIHLIDNGWKDGIQDIQEQKFCVQGITVPSSSEDIKMVPEGDRRSGMRTFFADLPLAVSNTITTSDICLYHGLQYKIVYLFDWSDNGFFKAIGTLQGDVSP
ncbi:hypothetical protein [Megasphaera sueciensis]|uniref:hypothetical protein n=1 Tax=Megasphaera sueciensis TaxID=349094 RepID=UPI003CFBF791